MNKMPDPISRDASVRYEVRSENNIIFAIKRKIITILAKIQLFQNDLRLTAFLREFYKDENQLMMVPSAAMPELLYLEDINALRPIETEEKKAMKEKCDEKTKTWLKIAFTNHDLDFKEHNGNIVCILLDIILYKDAQMVKLGSTLIKSYF